MTIREELQTKGEQCLFLVQVAPLLRAANDPKCVIIVTDFRFLQIVNSSLIQLFKMTS